MAEKRPQKNVDALNRLKQNRKVIYECINKWSSTSASGASRFLLILALFMHASKCEQGMCDSSSSLCPFFCCFTKYQ